MPETQLEDYLKSDTMHRVSTYAGYVHYGVEWYSIVYFTNGIAQARTTRSIFATIMEEVFYALDIALSTLFNHLCAEV